MLGEVEMNSLKTNIKNNIWHLLMLLSIPAVMSIYPLINNSKNGAQELITVIDRSIPFIPEFIVPYVIWYPFVILSLCYICFKDKKTYYRTLMGILAGGLISFVIFYFFQTTVTRPEIVGNDFFSNLVKLIYSADKPFNCFPSLHVMESYIIVKAVHSLENKEKWVVYTVDIIAWLIIISTQFVKQHVLIDIIGGIYLAEIMFMAMPYIGTATVKIYRNLKQGIRNYDGI